MPSFIIFSDDPFSFELKRASVSLFSGSYIPGSDRKVSIDVKDVIESVLSFQFRDILETYTQDTLIDTFNAYINDELICKFEVIKGGISNFGMTPQTFLQQHFLTWQPREKKVSYSSPEYLTYYAVTDCRVKLRAYIGDVETREIVISELQQGKIYTIPVMYAVISGKLDSYPACYDVWVESTDGSVRYSYIQRFVYEQTKSEQEDYIIFENSLGGVDCFRAYGNTVFNADNTHNIAIIDEQLNEYRIDTEYKYTKNTGYLNQYEMEWLKDFFPSTGKYIFKNNMLRKIVMIEDNVSSSEQDAVGSYEFTYRYADDNIYLNLPIHANSNTLASPMSIQSYNINNSLDLEPRMAEFPMQKLSEGTLFPVQEPFSESWHATNAGALANYIIEKINSLTDGRLLDNRFKGYYLTESSLEDAYPNPLYGDSAWVGEPFPGVVYTVENGKWKTSGKAPEFGDINLEDYATKEDLAAQDEKLAELSSGIDSLLSETKFSLKNVQISNLFDKDSPTQFTERHSGEGDKAYYYSDFMPVMGLDKIYSNIGALGGGTWWFFYDINGNVLNEPESASEMEVPEGAISLRILSRKDLIEAVKRNGVAVPYPNYNNGQPYGAVVISDEIQEFGARQGKASQTSVIGFLSALGLTSANLLFNVKRFADKELSKYGTEIHNEGSNFPLTDYITVEPSTEYIIRSAGHIAWYDSEKAFISIELSVGNKTLESPENAAYLRVCGGTAVFKNDDVYKKAKPYLFSPNANKGQRPVFIPAYGGMYIEENKLYLKGFFFYLGSYFDMRNFSNADAEVDISLAKETPGYIHYLMFDHTNLYGNGYIFVASYENSGNYPQATIWKGIVYNQALNRYFIDEFDGRNALSRYEGRNEAGSQTSEIINDWSYENLIDYTQFVDSTIPFTGEGTSDYYQMIDNVPCQENTWYWGWSTGYVTVFNNQKRSLGNYMIQSHGTAGLAFKTPRGAYTMRVYAAPTNNINQVRIVIGKSKVDISPYGVKKYKDPYFTNPYWFDLVNYNFWVNQVSADGFTNKFDNDYNYQIWIPVVGKTYTGNSKGFQAECYNINNELLHRFEEPDKTFTIPEGTAYCKTYTRVGTESTVMIIPGTTLPETYVPYGERISKAGTTDYYLNGRKYCGLGDSITDGDGNGSVSWYDYLLQRLHADSSSLNFAETGQCLRTMADRCTAENMQNVSKVFIMGGTNQMSHFSIGTIDDKPTPDLIESNRTYTVGERVLGGPKEKHGWTTPIYAYTIIYECTIEGNTGEVSDDFITTMPTTAEQTIQVGTATFKVIGYPTWYADMWRIVDTIWGFNNKCEIIWLVPIKTTSDVGKPASQWARKDKFQAVRDFCEYNSIRYIDLQKEFPLNSYTKDSIMADSLHPNKTGYEIICDIVMSHI